MWGRKRDSGVSEPSVTVVTVEILHQGPNRVRDVPCQVCLQSMFCGANPIPKLVVATAKRDTACSLRRSFCAGTSLFPCTPASCICAATFLSSLPMTFIAPMCTLAETKPSAVRTLVLTHRNPRPAFGAETSCPGHRVPHTYPHAVQRDPRFYTQKR